MPTTHRFEVRDAQFLLDGRPFQIRCGEVHYLRVPRPYWRDRLLKARAMGLNAVCAYVFWNAHEPREGEFDFAGNKDAAAFVRLAQELGLWVLLRPGPYCCAEWDFGGLPAWLLAKPELKVRCSEEPYLSAATRYLQRLARELAPLSVTRGGPILMVQVENEYGAYGSDKRYLAAVRDTIRASGFEDVPLFTCDWPNLAQLRPGSIEGATAVANFGSKASENIPRLRDLRPDSPPMCGEFWSGWFDAWGQARNGNADPQPPVREMRWMLENGVSFSLYMFHGGTSFGFTAGANQYEAYAPTVTSYDYWAPLDEAGRPTDKFFAFRDLLARHQPAGSASLPELPGDSPTTGTLGPIELTEWAGLLENLPEGFESVHPRPMEMHGQSHGLVLYRTDIAGQRQGELRVFDVHDYAHVSLNGRPLATLDRRLHQNMVKLEGIPDDRATLDILVDSTGRVNFGPWMMDRKGITSHVELRRQYVVMNWRVYPLPLDEGHLDSLQFGAAEGRRGRSPGFFRGTFQVGPGGLRRDTFLDLREFGRGVAWVNGQNLGRFWSIGPQQTLYLPGCWLREGENELMIFDLEPPAETPSVRGLAEPILNEPRPARQQA